MDIKTYEKDNNFNRNRAIFVLSTIDKLPIHQIATNFNLPADEIKNIITLHGKYEALMGE